MEHATVVTCFLRHRGEVLLLRRADDASTYPGRWAAVSGYVEHDEPVQTARMEIREETRIADAALVRGGGSFTVADPDASQEWTVTPFLFDVPGREVALNEETTAAEWAPPTAILRRETVPELWTSWERVAPTAETVGADTEHGSAALSVRALGALRDAAGHAAVEDRSFADVTSTARALLAARPSMAALRNRVHRAMAGATSPGEVEAAAIDGIERAFAVDREAAATAAERLPGSVLTLSRSGTVREALLAAEPAVVIAESRPAREGRAVAEELAVEGLDVSLCTDAAVASVLAERDVGAVVVGADTVLPDGRVVNKTGTRGAALAAAHEGMPCYAVAASDKISTDPEVHRETGEPAAVYDGDAPIEALNPTFDATPAGLVDGVLTERGELDAEGVRAVAEELRTLAAWRDER